MFTAIEKSKIQIMKLCQDYEFSERHYIFLKVKSMCKMRSWNSVNNLLNVKNCNVDSLIELLRKYKAPESQLVYYKSFQKNENASTILEGTLQEAQRAASALAESRQNLTSKATEYIRAFNTYNLS